MTDALENLSWEEFVILIPAHVFTDEEIAAKVVANRPVGREKVEVLQAVLALKGGGPVTGILRTAFRELEGLPPIHGD
jgi:hypothetical protein